MASDKFAPCVATDADKPVSAALVKRADHVMVNVAIESEQRDASIRIEEINQARRTLMEQARKSETFIAVTGSAQLNLRDNSGIKSFASGNNSIASVRVFVPLGSTNNIYDGAREIRKFIDGIKMPARVTVKLSDPKLSINSPGQYKLAIFNAIKQEAAAAQQALGTGDISVAGLESPVVVRQMDEVNVELYINYRLSVEVPGNKK